MTTTACDDQFTVAPAELVRHPYDTVAVLRRYVEYLEIALRKQTERAEAAEAELLAVREDNHSMMLEINSLRATAPSVADCRACANRGQVNGLSQESYCDGCVYQGRSWRKNHFVDARKMADAVKRRCEACAILPCSCK